MSAWLVILVVLQCGRQARCLGRGIALPEQPGRPARWEGFVAHLAATLRASQQMASLHLLCHPGARCASPQTLRRLNRQMVVAHTLTVADRLPPDWPVSRTNLIVLVGLDCAAIANLSLPLNDVVLMVSQRPPEAFLPGLAAAFETCWQADLLNALAVHGGSGSAEGLRVYTYFPYRAGYCHDMQPVLAAVWTPRSPRKPQALGVVAKLRDLGGCPLRVTIVKARPWVDFAPVNTSANFVTFGTLTPLVLTIAKYLNFTPQYFLPFDTERYGRPLRYPNFGGLLGDVYYNRSDMALMFSGADVVMPYHGRPNTAQVSCSTWCLPTGYWQPSIWRPIVGEFVADVWVLVLASYVLGTLSYRFFLPASRLGDTWLTALQGLVSGIPSVPEGLAPRAFLFCWSFYGLVLTTLYCAALHGINNVHASDTVFRTASDLFSSPLPLYASGDQLDSFNRATFDDPRERALVRRIKQFQYDKALDLFHLFFTRRDRGLLVYHSSCLAYGTMFTPPRQVARFHVIPNYCMFISAAYNFVMRVRSPLLPKFTTATNKLDEAGLTLHWEIKPDRPTSSSPDTVMRLRQVEPFLRMLAIGLSAATVAFLLELLKGGCCGPRRAKTKKTKKLRGRRGALGVNEEAARHRALPRAPPGRQARPRHYDDEPAAQRNIDQAYERHAGHAASDQLVAYFRRTAGPRY